MKLLAALKKYISLLVFIAIVALFAVAFVKLRILFNRTELHVDSEINAYSDTFYTAIERSGKALFPDNSTTANLATSLASSFNGSAPSFSTIMAKVAPTLFLAVSTIPKLTQASFASRDGLFVSFYREDRDRIFAVYSNTSFSSDWFTQPVNHDTGEPYGIAVVSKSMLTPNSQWFRSGLDSDGVVASMGRRWDTGERGVFLSTVSVHGNGVVSLGYGTDALVEHFSGMNSRGLYLQLVTQDGEVVVRSSGEAAVEIERFSGGILTVRNRVNGEAANLSCDSSGSVARSTAGKVAGIGGSFYCSTIVVGGVNMVYVLAYPGSGLMSQVGIIIRVSSINVGFLFSMVLLSVVLFLWKATRATKREYHLCASLIKQTEATQQAERKSMNKTRIYAGISHDARNALAQLVALIQFCREETASPDSKLAGDLQKVENCAVDAIAMFESVLDTNKLESGKLELKTEDFDLGKLVEDLVDRFYEMGVKKGVDIVLDLSDNFVSKSTRVHGDQTRFKQVLSNLLSNAIKFTSEGHVEVRATVRPTNRRRDIITANRTFAFASLLSSFCWDKCGVNCEDDLDTIQMAAAEDPNEVELEFEVDDTGKGIPKSEWKSVFEDYVQATNNNTSVSGGFGLGLGNVQSLVRLMKGELQIVPKPEGEKGTCFRFNIFLSTTSPTTLEAEQQPQQQPPPSFTLTSDSKVIILVEGEERRKVLKTQIEKTNVNVVIATHPLSLCQELETIRATSKFVLLLIDANYHRDLRDILLEFKRSAGVHSSKVVWVRNRFAAQEAREAPEGDYVVYKPFHGSRVAEVLSLLPGRNGTAPTPTQLQRVSSINSSSLTVELGNTDNNNCVASLEPNREDVVVDKQPMTGKKVLIVDDNTLLRKLHGMMMSKLGASSVEGCANGKEAVDRMSSAMREQDVPYDCILMDCEMPEMDGYEATRLIRAEEEIEGGRRRVAIVAISGHSSAEKVRMSMEAGMDFHLTKPLKPGELLDVVRKINANKES